MTSTAAYDPVQPVFESAIRQFRLDLGDDTLYSEILRTTKSEDVYDCLERLQKERNHAKRLRNISRIAPFLQRLGEYAEVIQVFIQAKPDILALIWGPAKLLLQWANAIEKSFDAILDTTAEIGNLLPEFEKTAKLFPRNAQINEVLALFFKDILEFYCIALKFFRMSNLKLIFEAMWKSHRNRIGVVIGHIERHALLLRNGARLEHLQEEHAARQRALDHYETTERFHQRQEYASIKVDINPLSFDGKFGWLQDRTCKGTGKWLLEDPIFKKWLSISDFSARNIWLQGIPGAGKTFLSSTAARESQAHGRTLFAFLSYTQDSSALAILHSLVFQLASLADDLQAILAQTSRERLKSNFDVAVDLFKSLLNCAGPTYTVIDGVDEMSEFERQKLLAALLEISDTCDETMWMFSSRVEADITRLLNGKTEAIRVDHRNTGTIQIFVNTFLQKWFQERIFSPEEEADIRGLLAPLSAKSEGMFLYAKIVLSSIEPLEFFDIHNELLVLPKDLKEAYHRAFVRINGFKVPSMRERARKILGWIGCTKVPVTLQELEQALTVGNHATRRSTGLTASLDVVRICGPIVEIVDGYVHYVHFTVKEYIFSPEVPDFIMESQAASSLAATCIAYLCQSHHDRKLTEEEISSNLIRGDYVMHHFASNTWQALVQHAAQKHESNTLPDELIDNLEIFMFERSNSEYDEAIELGQQTQQSHLESFDLPVAVKNFVSSSVHFYATKSSSQWRIRQNSTWPDLDPTVISTLSVCIYRLLDNLLCSGSGHKTNCACAKITAFHGPRPFKCGFVACDYHRYGFETRAHQNQHEKHHDKPWKCDFPGCQYRNGGFLSRKMRDDHLTKFHRRHHSMKANTTGTPDADELQPLLFNLVQADQTETLKQLLPQYKKLPRDVKRRLKAMAAASSSKYTFDLLEPDLNHPNIVADEISKKFNTIMKNYYGYYRLDDIMTTFLINSIQSHRPEIFKAVVQSIENCQHGMAKLFIPSLCPVFIPAIIESESDEVLEYWTQYLTVNHQMKAQEDDETWNPKMGIYRTIDLSTETFTIWKTNKNRKREEMLMAIWTLSNRTTPWNTKNLGEALINVALTTCSPRLVEYLIAAGVPVDYRRSTAWPTPLQLVARHNKSDAAESMRLLLYSGADPHNKAPRTHVAIRDEKGPKSISKWLGFSWDEMVRQAERSEAAKKREGMPIRWSENI